MNNRDKDNLIYKENKFGVLAIGQHRNCREHINLKIEINGDIKLILKDNLGGKEGYKLLGNINNFYESEWEYE